MVRNEVAKGFAHFWFQHRRLQLRMTMASILAGRQAGGLDPAWLSRIYPSSKVHPRLRAPIQCKCFIASLPSL